MSTDLTVLASGGPEQPLLLERIARHFVSEVPGDDNGTVLVGHDDVARIDRHAADPNRDLHLHGAQVGHAGRRRRGRAVDGKVELAEPIERLYLEWLLYANNVVLRPEYRDLLFG